MTMGFGSMKVTGDRDKGNIGGVMETNAWGEGIQDTVRGKELANIL